MQFGCGLSQGQMQRKNQKDKMLPAIFAKGECCCVGSKSK